MRRLLLGLGLLCLGFTEKVIANEPLQRWTQGTLSVRMLEAGYTRDAKTGNWESEVVLRFVNLSQDRRFNQSVQVQFVDTKDKLVGTWKTFLSLSPGQAQHRRVRAPSHLACQGDLANCPRMRMGLVLKSGKASSSLAVIPAQALKEEGAPPEGLPLYATRVIDGTTFQLLDGQKIHLLGLTTFEHNPKLAKKQGIALEREAKEYLRFRVMDGSVRLSFDGERRDPSGRWLALVRAEDGALINTELLEKGLARADLKTDYAERASFEKAMLSAKQNNLGLWAFDQL